MVGFVEPSMTTIVNWMMARQDLVQVSEPSLEFGRSLYLVLSMFSMMSNQCDGDPDGDPDEFPIWIGEPCTLCLLDSSVCGEQSRGVVALCEKTLNGSLCRLASGCRLDSRLVQRSGREGGFALGLVATGLSA